MVLKVLGSSSKGNCYVLENEKEALVIDCGVSINSVKEAVNYNTSKIVGAIVTHCHGDHAKYVDNVEKMWINVFKPYETHEKIVKFGGFTIQPFGLVHDVECYGFMIKHEEIGKLVYITDTEYCKYVFHDVNHFLIEANYDINTLDKESPNYEHIIKGHMSIQQTCEFLKHNNSTLLENVILCHLSGLNGNGEHFIEEAKKVVYCDVTVARKGMEINISLPF